MITIHILSHISSSKGNQIITFSQLTEYNLRSLFFFSKEEITYDSKSYVSGGTSPRPLSKKMKLSISVDLQSKFLYNLFLVYIQVKDYRNILKLMLTTCFYLT